MSLDETPKEPLAPAHDPSVHAPADTATAPDGEAADETSSSAPEGALEGGQEGNTEPTEADKGDAGSSGRSETDKGSDEPEGPPLLARGNPLQRKRGGITLGIGALGLVLLMAKNFQLALGVPLGFLFACIGAFGLMDLLGTFDDTQDEDVRHKTTLGALQKPLALCGGAALAHAGCLSLAQASVGPTWVWSILVTASFIALVAAVFQVGVVLGPFATDEAGKERPLLYRHGFWVVTVASLLYYPAMGTFSLWDPWETHYGEVAREILARDDWISLWWAQDGWFWSKPILNFWMQALAMASLGTHYRADQMLQGASGAIAHPEWVVRAPNVMLTIMGMYLLYKGAAKVFGRRAGLLGGIVLATMPDWFFLAHQTMTDMPFVASMTAAMGLLLLGLNIEESERTKLYEVRVGARVMRWSLWHLVFGAILICAVPQILYLATRNVELVLTGSGPKGFRVHWDEFQRGSAGNCGIPGNEACRMDQPALIPKTIGAQPEGILGIVGRLFGGFEPIIQALAWSVALGSLLYINWGERRVRRLCYIAAWFFAALATMGKGPAGFGMPIICAGAYVATKKRWSELLKLEMLSGLLVILVVAMPWYVSMYVRHGSPFTDRLIFHDMFNRAFGHVHDTNEGDDTSFRFYLWQLGYALFPWTALAPLGLTYWLRRGDSADKGKGDASVLLAMWFVFAFALFTFMGTKFHHYIFPAVPPVAMLVGVVLSDMLGTRTPRGMALLQQVLLYCAGTALLCFGVARFFPGSVLGTKAGQLSEAQPALGGAFALFGLALCGYGFWLAIRDEQPGAAESPSMLARMQHESRMMGAAAVAGAMLLVLVGRDLGSDGKTQGSDQPGPIRLLQLFTYNYRRPWPESLDFTAALIGFSVVAGLLCVLLAVRKIRMPAVIALSCLGFVWGLWGLDVYMTKTAPHWGQREVIEAYYKDRKGPDEKLIAYQMNWKGENFYTSNRIPAFVSTGATFTSWLKTEREKGTKVMYFVTEHSRTGGLRGEVGAKSYKELTDKTICNKFILVRAEL
jgi:4-amino-4-deoxy-L-arabinose transferase-like glycosyltransferase